MERTVGRTVTGNATNTESGSLRQRKEKLLYVSFVIVTGDAVSDRKAAGANWSMIGTAVTKTWPP